MTVMAAESAGGAAGAGRARAASNGRASQPRAPREPAGRQQQRQRSRAGEARRRAPTTPANRTSYQSVILAEFVVSIVLVAVTPFTSKNRAGLSPYVPADMFRLVAITLVYLILALVSSANREAGRVAAWLGALILVAATLDRGAQVAKDLELFGAKVESAAAPPAQTGGQP